MDDFGSFLKKRRVAKGLDQVDLSRLLSEKGVPVHNSLISRWEHNERLPGVDQREALLVIGDILGIRDDEKSDFLVKAGLAPIQHEEIDVDAVLQNMQKTWQKVGFLSRDLGWDEKPIANKLGIPFYQVRTELARADLLSGGQDPSRSLVLRITSAGGFAADPEGGKGGRLVAFTLGNCSDNVITVDRIALEVLECETHNRRMPIEARIMPIKYEVELDPFKRPGEYLVTTDRFRYAGRDADDFELVCDSKGGFRYRARLNIHYSDLATDKESAVHSEPFELYFYNRDITGRLLE